MNASWRLALPAALALAASGAACSGTIGDPPGGGGPPASTEDFSPGGASLHRLRAAEYKASVRDLLGDAAAEAVTTLPEDVALNGYTSIAAAQLALDDAAVAKYEIAARAAATAALGDDARIAELLGCAPTGPADAACHEQLVEHFGRLAFRRPLDADEITRWSGIAEEAASDYGDFYSGVAYAIGGMLQSPAFLYRVELGADDGSGRKVLKGYEMATRLSYLLLGTTPSSDLLDLAAAGKLDDAAGVSSVASELLAQDGAKAALHVFFSEMLRLGDLETTVKDDVAYPAWSASLAASMREETLRLLDGLVWEDGDFRDALTTDETWIDANLAALYGVDAPADGWAKVKLPAEQGRAGLLTQPSFLSLYSHVVKTSPTLRGKFVRERLLCQAIPAPPNNVVTDLPSDTEAKTMREKLEAHKSNPSCAGCHVKMDDIGLALENFDATGAWRDTENGETIDASGDVDGRAFYGAAELGTLLHDDPGVPACIVKNVFRFATGHVETQGELGSIDGMTDDFAASGFRVKDLVVSLVASDAFRVVGDPR